jgi:hypothetical protein
VIDGDDWLTAKDENSSDVNAKKRRILIGLYNIPSGAAEVACGSLVLCLGLSGRIDKRSAKKRESSEHDLRYA